MIAFNEKTFFNIANLIGVVDKGAANVYRHQPFNRTGILLAFMKGCQGTKYEDISFRIYALHHEAMEERKSQLQAEVA